MNRSLFLILIVVLIGTFLRFYRLGEIPVGLHRDEAFLGYNAYSILKTGKDMNGAFLPLHLQSFLYSPAGYSYFSIPFIAFFDLSAFSVRFASAFFGSLTIVITYFLTRELFRINSKSEYRNSKQYQNSNKQNSKLTLEIGNWKLEIPIIASAMLAISPWHINLSRTATENTVVVFFISLAVLLYLAWVQRGKWFLLLLSFFFFFITLFIYQAPRAFLPFFVPLLILLYTNAKSRTGNMFTVLLFFMTIALPLFIIFSSKDLSLRIRTVSIFSTQETQLVIDEQIRTDGVFQIPVLLTRVFHNKLVMYTQQFFKNYFAHFSYPFLFFDEGFPDRYRIPLVGLLYILELPILLFGIFRLAKADKRLCVLLLGWIAIVPVGSALAFDDVPNIQRTLIIFPALSMAEAFGLSQLIEFFKKNYWLKTLSAGLTIIFIYNVSFYLHQYYIHASRYRPWYRQDGYKELVVKVNKFLEKNEKAIITDRESAPTIFFLFYSKYPPIEFQKETKNTKMKDFDRISFGQYEFSQEECPLKETNEEEIRKENSMIYVNSGFCKAIQSMKEYREIKRKDNSTAFRIYTVGK